jgi:hypothetical protein
MRELHSSSDLRGHTELIKRLLDRGIPCAVIKKSDKAPLSVWIQHDSNFPQAVGVLADQNRGRPLPPWTCVLDKLPLEKPSADKLASTPEEENQLTLDFADDC